MNLEAVYPNVDNPNEEFSFEELRAKHRGWLARDWAAEKQQIADITQSSEVEQPSDTMSLVEGSEAADGELVRDLQQSLVLDDRYLAPSPTANVKEGSREGRTGRPRKMRIMEVKGETQTSKNAIMFICIKCAKRRQ